MSDARPDPTPEKPTFPIRFKWGALDDLDLEHVDHAYVQHINDHIYLSFGQNVVPFELPTDGSALDVEVQPIVRLIMTRDAAQSLQGLLTRIVGAPDKDQV